MAESELQAVAPAPRRSLLLVAHGSRREASNEEVRALARGLHRQLAASFGGVGCAFLELASPSIEEGVAAAAREGAEAIVVLPYFLAAGTHVARDIPRILETCRAAHPGLSIRSTPHLGAAGELPALLASLAQSGASRADSQRAGA